MTGRMAGRHALVTGGTMGIGEAIVRRFVEEGARVVVAARTAEPGERLVAELGGATEFRVLDVADELGWERLAEEYAEDPIDVLVNNAGRLHHPKTLVQLAPAEWRRELEVNLTGPFLGIRAFLPRMLEIGRGSIINIASMSAVRAQRDATAYQVAKAGVRWLAKNAAMTYADRGIRVNTINPGVITTPLQQSMPAERESWFFDRIPMGRTGNPAEVAQAAVFLASDESSYVTGAEIDVDGGYNL